MKNKLKSCAILATLGTITIHLINKTLIEMATKDSLLNSSEGNYYDCIMTGDLEKSIIENREMVNHYCFFMIWMQKALA